MNRFSKNVVITIYGGDDYPKTIDSMGKGTPEEVNFMEY